MIFNQRRPVVNPRQAQDKCEIRIKKMADGSVVKSVRGNCSKEQLRALADADDSQIVQGE